MPEASDHARADRPRFAIPDETSVRFDDGDNLRCRSGEETFIRDENVVPGDVGLCDFDSKLRRDFKDNQSRNPAQRARRDGRRENLTALDDENVIRRAFGDIASVI